MKKRIFSSTSVQNTPVPYGSKGGNLMQNNNNRENNRNQNERNQKENRK